MPRHVSPPGRASLSRSASRALHGLVKAALIIGALALAVLALLLAWWISLLLVGTWALYSGVRRWLRGSDSASAAGAPAGVIEGEYRVETNPQLESSPGAAGPDGGKPAD